MAKNTTNQSREDHRDTEDLLSAYMDKTLPESERLAFERQLAEDPFLADALEGLKQEDPGGVARSVRSLKKQLYRQVRKKERGKHRSAVMDNYMYWTIAIILLLAVAGYLVLQFLRHR